MHGLDLRNDDPTAREEPEAESPAGRKRVLLSAGVLIVTVVLWVCGLPPRSLGVFAAVALVYWALLDRFDRLALAGALLVAEAIPAWIEGLPHPWVGVISGVAVMAWRWRSSART